ncbi:LuxR family transcriptional regulator [Gordonia sinesedis]
MITAATCVGRDDELSELLDRARTAERPTVIEVVGEPGIGKSTLLRRLADIASEAGVRVVAASATSHLSALLAPDGDDRPMLVTVDDADRLAPETLSALRSALAALPSAPVTIVATVTDQTPDVAALLPDTLRLAGLSDAAVAALAAQRDVVMHPAMAQRLARHTTGNPRHVIALLDELPAGIWAHNDIDLPAPAAVVGDVTTRLGACTPPTQALIEAIAILDDPESLGTALELGRSRPDADELVTNPLTAVDEALRSGLVAAPGALTPADADPQPANPMIRAAVLGTMGVRSVGDMHRRAAELVTDPVRRLRHLVAATPAPDAALADDLDAVAHQRGADGSWAEAAELFRQAGRLTDDPLLRERRITESVDALLAAGDCVGAGALVPAVESLRETPLRNATLAYLAILRGRSVEAGLRLERAWGIVGYEREPDVAAIIAQRYVLHSLVRLDGDDLVAWADRAVDLAGRSSPAGVEAAAIRGLGLAWSGRVGEAIESYDRLVDEVRYGAQAQRITMGRGWLQFGIDDVYSARSSLETAVSMAQLGGSQRITLWALAWLARVQFATGDWERAMATASHDAALARSSGIELTVPLSRWTTSQIHALRGDWPAADADLAAAVATSGDYEIMRVPTLLARAQIAEAQADYARVCRALEPLRLLADTTPALNEPGWWPWVDVYANALVLEGRLDEADTLLRPHEARAAEHGHVSAGARLRYARGRYLGAIGDIHGARRVFEEALELLEPLPLRYDLARVNFAYGQTLRRAGKRRAADSVIGTAREIYQSLGADAYVARCDRELNASGLHPVRGARADVDLTPQEQAVTALVAQGMSNRDVAAELFISPKTVQYHLTRIYAKLGVRSRTELAALRQ